jgi:hypothetical protein
MRGGAALHVFKNRTGKWYHFNTVHGGTPQCRPPSRFASRGRKAMKCSVKVLLLLPFLGGKAWVPHYFGAAAATRSCLAPLANTNESKRGRRAAAQKSSTHRRLRSAPRVLARVSSRREAVGGSFPETLPVRVFLCIQFIEYDEKSCLL